MAALYGDAARVAKLAQSMGASKEKAESAVRTTLSSSSGSSTRTNSAGMVAPIGPNDPVTPQNVGAVTQFLSPYMTPTAKSNLGGISSSIASSLSANQPLNVQELSQFSGIGTKLEKQPTPDYLNNYGIGIESLVKSTEQQQADARKQAELTQTDMLKQYMQEEPERLEVPQELQKAKEQAMIQANQYKSQIDMINAQLQANLQQLRQTGSQEGVTEAVYGGQQLQLNREAAVKLMPLAALYQASLDNYQAAKEIVQDFITQENQYLDRYWSWKNNVYDKAFQYADQREQRAVEDVRRAEDQALSAQKDANNMKLDIISSYLDNGQKPPQSLLSYDVNNPNSMNDLMTYAGNAPVKVDKASAEKDKPLDPSALAGYIKGLEDDKLTVSNIPAEYRDAVVSAVYKDTYTLPRWTWTPNAAKMRDEFATVGVDDTAFAEVKSYLDDGYSLDEIIAAAPSKFNQERIDLFYKYLKETN
jgi:hypothetical protein